MARFHQPHLSSMYCDLLWISRPPLASRFRCQFRSFLSQPILYLATQVRARTCSEHALRRVDYNIKSYIVVFVVESMAMVPMQQIRPLELGLLPDPGFGCAFRVGPSAPGRYLHCTLWHLILCLGIAWPAGAAPAKPNGSILTLGAHGNWVLGWEKKRISEERESKRKKLRDEPGKLERRNLSASQSVGNQPVTGWTAHEENMWQRDFSPRVSVQGSLDMSDRRSELSAWSSRSNPSAAGGWMSAAWVGLGRKGQSRWYYTGCG